MFRSFRGLSVTLSAALFAVAAIAPSAKADDDHKLIDNVGEVIITNTGLVGVDLLSDNTEAHWYVCSLRETRQSVTTQTCEGWLSVLLGAQLSGKKVRLDYGTVAPKGDGPVSHVKIYRN